MERQNGLIKLEELRIVWEVDDNPDLSWLGEYTDNPKLDAIDRAALGHWSRREYRFFQPASEYPMQDYERMEDYNRGYWHMTGCYAKAVVSYDIGNHNRRLEFFTSGGLWGIESDSDPTYKVEVEKDELANLRAHLAVFGVDLSNWDSLTEGLES